MNSQVIMLGYETAWTTSGMYNTPEQRSSKDNRNGGVSKDESIDKSSIDVVLCGRAQR